MIPIVDMHCHLLAGLDDGPREPDQALEMCRMLAQQGVGSVLALAHQNEQYPSVSPDRIRESIQTLKELVRSERIPIAVFPGAEVMVHPTVLASVDKKEYLTIGDTGKYVLIELPHGLFIDLREIVSGLMQRGIRPLLAHPEQCPELLFSERLADELVQLGCLFQLSTGNVTLARDRRFAQAIKSWVRRGLIHVVGSDGHSPVRRPPLLADACRIIASWIGASAADRVCGTNAMAILEGRPLPTAPPQPQGTVFSLVKRWLRR
jgi:protein-tyrosine phosphatase